MNLPMPTPPAAALSLLDPFGFGRAAGRYWLDAFERSVLYLDVMRVRGIQYLEHIEQTRPSVLGFDAEVLMDGRERSEERRVGKECIGRGWRYVEDRRHRYF